MNQTNGNRNLAYGNRNQAYGNRDREDITVIAIGLGLIGGSLVKALKEKAGISDIYGIDANPATILQAMEDGCIQAGWRSMEEMTADPQIHCIAGRQVLVFFCTPVEETLKLLDRPDLFLRLGAGGYLLTDTGSIKEVIVEKASSLPGCLPFIGGHPMAGSEKSGYKAARSHLFENAFYILVPGKGAAKESISLLSGLIGKIGAYPLVLEAADHDRAAAAISHVPHVVASALVQSSMESDCGADLLQKLAAGGFKDITRIASSDPEMWEKISMMNRKWIIPLLRAYIRNMDRFIACLEMEDQNGVRSFFSRARELRESFPDAPAGFFPSLFHIEVDVKDRPGVIGSVAALLGEHGINIRNIMVTNSRELEQGCLRITLPDASSAESACRILSANGYRVFGLGRQWQQEGGK